MKLKLHISIALATLAFSLTNAGVESNLVSRSPTKHPENLEPTSKYPFQIISESQLITFPSVLGRQYQVLLSTDLKTWTLHSTHSGTGSEISAPLDSDEPAAFYRVQVSLKEFNTINLPA